MSGDLINRNPSGYANANGIVSDQTFGNIYWDFNKGYRSYGGFIAHGEWGYNAYISNNTVSGWTDEYGLGISYEGIRGRLENNTFLASECRTPYEIYGAENYFDLGKSLCYLGNSTGKSQLNRINAPGQIQLVFTGGFNNQYYGYVSYDSLYGVSPKGATALRGIHISGQVTQGYGPSSWKGKNYLNGFDFHCTIEGVTGRAVFAEINGVKISNVCFYSDFKVITSAWRSGENLIAIYAPDASTGRKGWYAYDPVFDVNASTSPDSTYNIFGFVKFNTSNQLVSSDIRTLSGIYGARIYQNNNAKLYTNNQFAPGAAIIPRVVTQRNSGN